MALYGKLIKLVRKL